jgi:cell wall-associated NlpC family hydrolase
MACGAMPADAPQIAGSPAATRHSTQSQMTPWLDAQPYFQRVQGANIVHELQPGDVVGLRIYRCVDHLGLVLTEGRFIHVLMHKNTDIDLVAVPPWQQHIEAAWRPVES